MTSPTLSDLPEFDYVHEMESIMKIKRDRSNPNSNHDTTEEIFIAFISSVPFT